MVLYLVGVNDVQIGSAHTGFFDWEGGGGSARYAEGVSGKTGQVWGVRGLGVSHWRWEGLR